MRADYWVHLSATLGRRTTTGHHQLQLLFLQVVKITKQNWTEPLTQLLTRLVIHPKKLDAIRGQTLYKGQNPSRTPLPRSVRCPALSPLEPSGALPSSLLRWAAPPPFLLSRGARRSRLSHLFYRSDPATIVQSATTDDRTPIPRAASGYPASPSWAVGAGRLLSPTRPTQVDDDSCGDCLASPLAGW